MIPTQKPYNSLPPLPPSAVFDDIAILKKANKANQAVYRLDGLIRSVKEPEMILGPLKVKEAVESSGIENIHTTMAEALQAELVSGEKLTPEQKETKNYKQALLRGYEIIKEKGYISTNSIIDIQHALGIKHAGIRNLPGTKIANHTTGEIYYTPPEGQERILHLLKNFEDYYNDTQDDPDYLIRMAILHYQFEAIHPFFDGNGRTGRMLMVLYLVLQRILVTPTLFISQYINRNRSDYYRLLREVTFKQNWHEWILFILDATEVQAIATNKTILDILDLEKHCKETILPQFNFTYHQEFLTYLFSNPFYTQSNLMQHTPIKSNKTAGEYLNTLEDNGILKAVETKSKEKMYYYDDLLKLLG